jgi:CheY-like chemotaxis protein
MAEEALQHVFEPFFTTKAEGKGTGLGLSTVYGIVHQCGGWISVQSEPGHGTAFSIYLPRTEASAAGHEVSAPAPATLEGSETILVVEDQEDVRKLATEILRSYGYLVLEARMGDEALLLSERYPGPIHLMLTDVVMPGMTGAELVERFKPLRPQMRVIYMSGFAADVIAHQGVLDISVDYISKPFSPARLASKVREVLGPPRPAATILVVDDEEGIRNLFQQVLTDAGYKVWLASDGRQALKLLRDTRFNVVFTDLLMPGRDGTETIRVIRKEYPNQKIIAVSGAFGGALPAPEDTLGADATLAKPVSPDELLAAVQELLSADERMR